MSGDKVSCDMWTAQLDAFVDGESAPADLEAHLRECPDCARAALERMTTKRATKLAADRYAPSPEFRLRVTQSLRKQRKAAFSLAWRPGLIAVAATLLLAVASAFLWTRQLRRDQAVAELLDLHVATLASANPVDVISTDRHTVKPWFQGRLPFSFNLPELGSTQFKLVGGKVAYFKHNPAAQLIVSSGKHEISVFILQDQPGAIPAALVGGATREHGFNIETWTQGGLRFAAVSDTNPADIHALAELLKAAGRT